MRDGRMRILAITKTGDFARFEKRVSQIAIAMALALACMALPCSHSMRARFPVLPQIGHFAA